MSAMHRAFRATTYSGRGDRSTVTVVDAPSVNPNDAIEKAAKRIRQGRETPVTASELKEWAKTPVGLLTPLQLDVLASFRDIFKSK